MKEDNKLPVHMRVRKLKVLESFLLFIIFAKSPRLKYSFLGVPGESRCEKAAQINQPSTHSVSSQCSLIMYSSSENVLLYVGTSKILV